MVQTCSVPSPLHTTRDTPLFYFMPRAKNTVFTFCRKYLKTKNPALSDHLFSILSVSFIYNLRVRECLNISSADLIGCDRAVISGVKGSRSAVIYLPEVDDQILPYVPLGDTVKLFPIPYKRIYTQCRRAGIGMAVNGHHNVAVTHISRYLTATDVAAQYGRSAASDVLRHKSKRSVDYYINPQG